MISSSERYSKKYVTVDGLRMAYVESGDGDPIVFLHGNPTSSYLWRNIIPHMEGLGRCIAPDLIGMGDSQKLAVSNKYSYSLAEHIKFFDSFLNAINVSKRVVFVAHDWGGPIAFNWAQQNVEQASGIVFMETIVSPMTWEHWPNQSRSLFEGFRSDAGEGLILEKNIFVEKVLPGSILRTLSKEEMEVYRRPFSEKGEGRRPTLSWPRQIPIDGSPEESFRIIQNNDRFMQKNEIPKLFINAEPGAILTDVMRDHCRTWPNTQEVTVSGSHFIQEDSPDEIGKAIASWYRTFWPPIIRSAKV